MRTCEWISAPIPSHHAWLSASQIAGVCHWSRCIDFPALTSAGMPVHTSPNWVRDFLCTSKLSCWETSLEPCTATSYKSPSPREMKGTGLRGRADEVGLSFYCTWSPASISFLMGLTVMAEVRVKPRLLPQLPRLSTLGPEQYHQALYLSQGSPLGLESGAEGWIRDKWVY